MPIQLDKILADIAEEKVLHPNYTGASKKEVDDAWTRVGRSNKLSVHETRSIFKVLQKKYEQEKSKPSPSWKLFSIMEQIHQKDIKPNVKQEAEIDVPIEEDEEYEMLEVQEEEEHSGQNHPLPSQTGGSGSDGESPSKSAKPNSSPEKDEKPLVKHLVNSVKTRQSTNPATTKHSASNNAAITTNDEKKLLNTMASATPRPPPNAATPKITSTVTPKGITIRKTTASTAANSGGSVSKIQNRISPGRAGVHKFEVGKTIQLPESIKRKLSEDQSPIPLCKKMNSGLPASQSPLAAAAAAAAKPPSQHAPHTTIHSTQIKQEGEEENAQSNAASQGINVITIPANPTRADLANGLVGGGASSTAATVASTSTNGFSPRIEDIDFRNDIIFDSNTGANGGSGNKSNANATEIINLGNFDNSLPPTFFKNLCNSSRHEALGLYVANVMNRLQPRSAAKLELGILRAIIDVQSDDFEQ